MIAVANLHGGSTRLLARRQILYVQSYGDFVRIVTADGRYLLRSTLADIERRWEPHGFVRVHRQYVANLRNAVELAPMLGGTAELTFSDGQTIPVARRHTASWAGGSASEAEPPAVALQTRASAGRRSRRPAASCQRCRGRRPGCRRSRACLSSRCCRCSFRAC